MCITWEYAQLPHPLKFLCGAVQNLQQTILAGKQQQWIASTDRPLASKELFGLLESATQSPHAAVTNHLQESGELIEQVQKSSGNGTHIFVDISLENFNCTSRKAFVDGRL